jgi:hypothetical protein
LPFPCADAERANAEAEKEARLSERSEFARFPLRHLLFREPPKAAAEPGSPSFGDFSWRDKKSYPLPGGSRQSLHEALHVLQHRRNARKKRNGIAACAGNNSALNQSSMSAHEHQARRYVS